MEKLTRDQRRIVAQALRDPPTDLFGPVRRWDFVLVLLGERPACRLISTRELVSPRGVADLRTRPEEFARGEFLGQLLRECALPFEVRFPRSTTRDTSKLHAAYYVAVTPERFERLPDSVAVSPEERADSWMNRPRAVGQFLGYPADAIDAYEANACSGNGEWTGPIPESAIDQRVRPLVDQLYDEPPLSFADILDAVLPYTPPLPSFGTSDEHFKRAVRYLEAGVRAERYGIRVLRDLLAYHQRRQ
jgi:hypothetical protein